ncbi:MAG TPA: metal-sensitive transcriptional regulator [Thermoanaerobaculia bacterium]|nr:metal-sensitive transcriptional regulator [Thermoanaerobaculia bacterium]
MTPEIRENAARRLRKIGGQVAGLERMLTGGRYCVDVLSQVAAAQAALAEVGKLVLADHVQTCVASAMASGDEAERTRKLEELLDVFSRFGQLKQR